MDNLSNPDFGYELTIPIECPPGENPAEIYLEGLNSHHSRRNLSRYLDQVAAFLSNGFCNAINLNWPELRLHHMATTVALFTEEYSPSTVNGMLSAVRGVILEAYRLGQISKTHYEQITSIPNVKQQRSLSGRELSYQEVQALLQTCKIDRTEQGAKDRRDAAMIVLLYSTGMKRSELVALNYEDYHPASGRLQIVTGKPKQDRVVILKPQPKMFVDKWLRMRDEALGALFNPVNKGGRIMRGEKITTQAVYNMLRERSAQAQIEQVTPHDLRRTFLAGALRAGAKTAIVADIVGHISPETTRRYRKEIKKEKTKNTSQ